MECDSDYLAYFSNPNVYYNEITDPDNYFPWDYDPTEALYRDLNQAWYGNGNGFVEQPHVPEQNYTELMPVSSCSWDNSPTSGPPPLIPFSAAFTSLHTTPSTPQAPPPLFNQAQEPGTGLSGGTGSSNYSNLSYSDSSSEDESSLSDGGDGTDPSFVPSNTDARNKKRSMRGIDSTTRQKRQRHAANVRERRRMKTINEAFEKLRERIPISGEDRKLSKVDTLRMAVRYIQEMSTFLESFGEGTLASQKKAEKARAVIVRSKLLPCSIRRVVGMDPFSGEPREEELELCGHALSWTDERNYYCSTVNHRMTAPLWIPELASQEDLKLLQNGNDLD